MLEMNSYPDSAEKEGESLSPTSVWKEKNITNTLFSDKSVTVLGSVFGQEFIKDHPTTKALKDMKTFHEKKTPLFYDSLVFLCPFLPYLDVDFSGEGGLIIFFSIHEGSRQNHSG